MDECQRKSGGGLCISLTSLPVLFALPNNKGKLCTLNAKPQSSFVRMLLQEYPTLVTDYAKLFGKLRVPACLRSQQTTHAF